MGAYKKRLGTVAFVYKDEERLTDGINEWLRHIDPKDIRDIKYSMASDENNNYFSAMIIYEWEEV